MSGRLPKDATLERLRSQLSMAISARDKAEEAKICNNIGRHLQYQLGDVQGAIKYHERDARCCYETSNTRGQAIAHQNLGDCYLHERDFAKAKDHYEKFLKCAEDLGQTDVDYYRAVVCMGNYYKEKADLASEADKDADTRASDAASSHDYYKRALQLLPRVVAPKGESQSFTVQAEASLLWNLGTVYDLRGNFEKAMRSYTRSLELFQRLKDVSSQIALFNVIGATLSANGQYAQAFDYHQRALRMAKERKDYRQQYDTLRELGVLHHRKKDYGAAIDYYEQALQMLRSNFPKDTVALDEIGATISAARSIQSAKENADIVFRKQNPKTDEIVEACAFMLEEGDRESLAQCHVLGKRLLGLARSAGDLRYEATALYFMGAASHNEDTLQNALRAVDGLENRLAHGIAGDNRFAAGEQMRCTLSKLRADIWSAIADVIKEMGGRTDDYQAAFVQAEKYAVLYETMAHPESLDDDEEEEHADQQDALDSVPLHKKPRKDVEILSSESSLSDASDADEPMSGVDYARGHANTSMASRSKAGGSVVKHRGSSRGHLSSQLEKSFADSRDAATDNGWGGDEAESGFRPNASIPVPPVQSATVGASQNAGSVSSPLSGTPQTLLVHLSPSMSLVLPMHSERGPLLVTSVILKIVDAAVEEFGSKPHIRCLKFEGAILPHSSYLLLSMSPVAADIDFWEPVSPDVRFVTLCAQRNVRPPVAQLPFDPEFRSISVPNCNLTDALVSCLLEAHMHRLRDIKIIDFSGNTFLTDTSLALLCRLTTLTDLSCVRMSFMRASLTGVTVFVKFLQRTSSGSLQMLDLSGCVAPSISMTLFNRFPSLCTLNLSVMGIGQLDTYPSARDVILDSNMLQSLPTVPHLVDGADLVLNARLQKNRLRGQDVYTILRVYPRLQCLDFSYNQVNSFDTSSLLLQPVAQFLRTLDLSHNPLEENGGEQIAHLLCHPSVQLPQLTRLVLDSCAMPMQTILSLLSAISQRLQLLRVQQHGILQYVSIVANCTIPATLEAPLTVRMQMLASVVDQLGSTTIVEVDMSGNGIRDDLLRTLITQRLKVLVSAVSSTA